LDEHLLHLANSVQLISARFNYALAEVSSNPLTKGLPLVALFWGFWFAKSGGAYPYRAKVLAGMIVSIAAIIVGRALAVIMPFRLRPMHDPDVALIPAEHLGPNVLAGWSSMPSDHAIFFAAMCTCIVAIHRVIGVLISLYCFCVVLLPRVIFGLHWPSDILVGVVVGVAVALLTLGVATRVVSEGKWIEKMTRHEAIFYTVMFLLTFQMATLFESSRDFLQLASSFASYLLTRI
jgi:undecaprenyl-diphosphatase